MMNNKWEVKKVLDVEINCDICCNLCGEVIYNYLEQCPVCKLKNSKLEEHGCLQTYFQGKRDICACSNCKSKFKLVSDEWYYPNFPEPLEDETKVISI